MKNQYTLFFIVKNYSNLLDIIKITCQKYIICQKPIYMSNNLHDKIKTTCQKIYYLSKSNLHVKIIYLTKLKLHVKNILFVKLQFTCQIIYLTK